MASLQRTPQANLPCPTWVWSNNSNVHVAKDRSWFGDDYVSLNSAINSMTGTLIEVIGIGTVDLPTKASPNRNGPRSHGTLRLRNVLHAPSIICNIIGSPVLDDYHVVTLVSGTSSGSIHRLSDSRRIAYFMPAPQAARFFQVRLSGPPVGPKVGPPPFDPFTKYLLRVEWPDSERKKHDNAQLLLLDKDIDEGPLRANENAWVKKHYGDEFKFLQAHGLSIFKEKDRAEGRIIVRNMISRNNEETSAT
ncbi:hypothetical protein FOXG_17080 [Fusarium oxysporum f. sp. lycopersici 4287]|uniref:Retrovirus-related Pol polyprotein from transposon TNT 1-94-like beta-barrel domain-containing protein n=1 Tax=Fusarium oxysporum f. sp. lycopersici (strain 4287 / CBS 123668 / FGSC 9935 / NRRL 34936) TaxID=426428 RepID=A0A0J9VSS0_FUSO4|nr:hypothetical protein FOXG_12545 [Fusarium oxysporum f. sp. lycopersici 4287]XP_018252094.1 hypothetical protein FOXG_12595 [Fusarium oxysporum f. sp. lycopersici 4287]XP_018253488.1 hypothetical protein FOXG_13996 [Fusarium oxysporum f. sp. lycopersici 4287]XP_018257953.1 hypothetical protein FOXG_17080 [Fusarium oxysporum f. sp. lycopersici 4287]KAJ9412559.1 hypothetical protein QL093DRAFT_2543301 [Fusarium oxysporum]KNB13939.1 hypothetical protein FOXG_12545 [Fusarium oxysporum f. sp. lyc